MVRDRTKLLACIAAVVVAGIAFVSYSWIEGVDSIGVRDAAHRPDLEARNDGRSRPTSDFETLSRSSAEAPDEADVSMPSPGPSSEPPSAVDSVVVDGRVIVKDIDGVEHLSESGTMDVIVPFTPGFEGGGAWEVVEIERGRWTVTLPRGVPIEVRRIRLGDRAATHDREWEEIEVVPGEVMVIRATWAASTRLHVVDAETGVSLDGIEVRQARNHVGFGEHPGGTALRPLIENGASPVEIPPAGEYESRGFFVRTPRHAWSRVTLARQGGERTIELQPGGSLRIDWIHDGEVRNTWVRVYREYEVEWDTESMVDSARSSIADMDETETAAALRELESLSSSGEASFDPMVDVLAALLRGEEPRSEDIEQLEELDEILGSDRGSLVLEELARNRDSIRFDSLVPGSYSVRAELGRHDDAVVLDAASVVVPRGGVGLATLEWSKPEEPVLGTLAGTVRYSKEWDESSILGEYGAARVRVSLLGKSALGAETDRRIVLSPASIEGDVRVRTWDAGRVEPGRYLLAVGSMSEPEIIDVRPGESVVHSMELSKPAVVRLTIVERGSGERAPVEQLTWYLEGAFELVGGSGETEFPDDEPGAFTFVAPVGKLVVSVWNDDHRIPAASIDVLPGENRVTLEATRVHRLTIVCKDGNTVVPWNGLLWLDVDSVDGRGSVVSQGGSERIRVGVDEPGHYRISIGVIEGYEPVPPFEVEIESGRDVVHEVQLEPVR